jgi:hypothetical protein
MAVAGLRNQARIVLRSIMGHCSEAMTARSAGVDSADKRAAIVKVFPGSKPAETV